jgi:protocatechuate 3,4-dioxygenase beta subunit
VLLTAVLAGAQAPVRDNTQPAARRIPVGTASISGTVVSTDTGRPIRDARVSLNGLAGAVPAGRGIAPPTPDAPGPPTLSISRTAVSDSQGRFTFTRLAAGRYSVSVNRDGYLSASYGQSRPNAGTFPAIELADGQQRAISIGMIRGGVLAGRVFDEDGEPMRNVQVQAWRLDRSSGSRRLQQMNGAQTNDRGAYRVFGLQPGRYLVSATPRNANPILAPNAADIAIVEQAIATGKVNTPPSGPAYVMAPPPVQLTSPVRFTQPPGYLPVYFPGSLTASSAAVLTITGSEEYEGLDIQLQHVQATSIRGTIVPPPPMGVSVQVGLISADPMSGTQSTFIGVNQEDGMFTFNSVAPGRYTMFAQTRLQPSGLVESARVIVDGKPLAANTRIRLENSQPSPDADAEERMWAHAEVVVNGEPTLEVTLGLQRARTISGKVTFNTSGEQPRAGTVNLETALGSDFRVGSDPNASIADDGSFVLKGVVPGRYFVRAAWTMSAATLGGADLLDLPLDVKGDRDISGLEITVTDRITQVHGTLTDVSDKPMGNHMVVVASTDQRYWLPGSRRITAATTGPYGRYTFRLPPGDYVVGAVADFESGIQYDPEFLADLMTTGARVTLEEGRSVEQNLRTR